MTDPMRKIAVELVRIIDALDLSPKIKGQLWAPKQLAKLPAAVVEVPAVTRTELEDAESQLGSDDWTLEYLVTFYFDLADPIRAQESSVAAVEAFISAVDDDTALANLVLDARVTSTQPGVPEDAARPLFLTTCTVKCLVLVDS